MIFLLLQLILKLIRGYENITFLFVNCLLTLNNSNKKAQPIELPINTSISKLYFNNTLKVLFTSFIVSLNLLNKL